MIFYLADLFGVAVFAASGALAAAHSGLDLFGILVIAFITAIGGGTLRDLLMDRHPIFWIKDSTCLIVILVAALLTILYGYFYPPPEKALLIPDAFGLALFAMSGAEIAEEAGHSPMIIVLMGTMTGVAGGVMRDVLSAKVPLLLQKDIYATAAIAGIILYLILQNFGLKRTWAFGFGMVMILGLRLTAVALNWQLPTFP